MRSGPPLSFRLFTAGVLATFCVVALLPVAAVFAASVIGGGLDGYRAVLADGRQWGLLRNTLAIAAGSALFATVLGAPLGFAVEWVRVPGRRALAAALAVPLLIPPYVGATVWAGILGRQGLVRFGINPAGQDLAVFPIYTVAGVILVLALSHFPIPAFAAVLALRRYQVRVEEPARMVASPARTFCAVTLPLIAPAMATGALVVFVLALVEFTVPSLLQVNVYAVEIYERFSVSYDAAQAAAQSVPLLACGALAFALWGAYVLPRQGRLPGGGEGAPAPSRAWGTAAACWLVVAGAALLPLAMLVRDSLPPDSYREIWASAGDEIRATVAVSALAATALTALAAPMAFTARHLPLLRRVHALSLVPFLVSGPLLGIGLILVWNRAGFPARVYDSAAILVVASAAHFLFFAYAGVHSALRDLPVALDEAAAASGVSWWRTGFGVSLPLLGPALAGVWGMGFVLTARELDAAVLVAPPGWNTLAIRLFSLMHYGPDRLTAALGVVSTAIVLGAALVTALVYGGARRLVHGRR